jgi:hypothetical protein
LKKLASACREIRGQRRSAGVRVSGRVSVSDQRTAGCVGDSRVRERCAAHALRIPRTAHELAHALAHATRDPRARASRGPGVSRQGVAKG